MKEMGFMGDGNFVKPRRTWSNPELVTDRQQCHPWLEKQREEVFQSEQLRLPSRGLVKRTLTP